MDGHGGENNERFAAVAAHLRMRLVSCALEDAEIRYDLSCLAIDLRALADQAIVDWALDRLALAAGVERTDLVRYARVRCRISEAEFREHLALRNSRGLPLSWSHFERLARVSSARLRRQLAEAAVAADWSVHTLSFQIRALKEKRRRRRSSRPP